MLDRLAKALSFVAAALGCLLLLGMTFLPGLLNYKPYVVLSGSMAPSIPQGAVVIAVPADPSSLRLGDVIMYDHPELHASITHRIVDIEGDAASPTFLTKGDANQAPDTWTVKYDGKAGKVVASVPFAGYLYHALGSREGHLVFLIVPVAILCIMYLAEIWRPKVALDRPDTEVPTGLAPALDLSPAKITSSARSLLPLGSHEPGPSSPLRQ